MKNVPNIKRLIFLYISMAFPQQMSHGLWNWKHTRNVNVLDILNYTQSRPFVLIRLHHLGHWRGDLNSELFLVNKKYQKLLKHTQSRQKLQYLKTTRLLLFIESTNKMFVNYIPTGPVHSVKSNTKHINKIHACDVFNNAIPRINVWVTLLAYKISGYLR